MIPPSRRPRISDSHQAAANEARDFYTAPEENFYSVRAIAWVLGVSRNHMNRIPVARIQIGGLAVYRKRHIIAWMRRDAALERGLLHELREKYAQSVKRRLRETRRERHY